MTRAAQLNRPPSRTRNARSGGAVRPSLADCKAVFQAKTSRQPYSKKRYSACKWSRPFLYRKEDNEYRKGKKRHLDWVGRRLSRPRKTMKDRFKSKLRGTMATYDQEYREQVDELENRLKAARKLLTGNSGLEQAQRRLKSDIDTEDWISKQRRVLADGEKFMASLRRRQTTPDIRDSPNVDFKQTGRSDPGRLAAFNSYLRKLIVSENPLRARRHSST